MESRYLRKLLGGCLSQALADVVKFQPVDPIEYLAFWLYKYKKNLVAEEMREMELAQLEREKELAQLEQQMLEQLKEEEQMFQQRELELQEKERQKLEELEKEQLEMELLERKKLALEEEEKLASQEEQSGEEEEYIGEIPVEGDDLNKTLAEISDRYGAPNLTRVEELDEPTVSDVALAYDKEGKEQ